MPGERHVIHSRNLKGFLLPVGVESLRLPLRDSASQLEIPSVTKTSGPPNWCGVPIMLGLSDRNCG